MALQTMELADLVFLTSVDQQGFPQPRAMFNLRSTTKFPGLIKFFQGQTDEFMAYFSTNTSLPKTQRLTANPRVSAYYTVPEQWRGLTVVGCAEIVTAMEIKQSIWQEGWELYYPGGVNDPDYCIFRVVPLYAQYYHQLQHFRFDF